MSQLNPAAVIDYSAPQITGGFWTQTWAMLVDAYRDLHSKKLFWITLVLSVLIVAAFAFVGINERGITVFGKEWPGIWNTTIIPRQTFYRWLFTELAIPIWLGWAASILALISVGGMFPDLLGGGSIDLYLAKPISRLRLFLTKYFCGLLFVALQVFVFSLASFLVIGFRGGTWEYGIFLAVPLVTLFFSYLFCICTLLGVLTRSTLAAILLTLLLWFVLFMVNAADASLLQFRTAAQERVERVAASVKFNEDVLANNAQQPPEKRANLSSFEFQRDRQKEKLAEVQETARQFRFWHRLMVGIKTPLPKTGETIALMSRWLVDPDPFFAATEQEHSDRQQRRAARGAGSTTAAAASRPSDNLETYMHDPQVARQVAETITARSVAWVVGTSVGFEAVVLALAGWVFCRRDY
jgi:ABC-type transport system involved in multi-copper enzyme maturation permease subunit